MESRNQPLLFEKSDNPEYDARFTLSASTPDRVKDTIAPGAYAAAIKGLDKIPALFNHDTSKILGYWGDLKTVKDTLQGSIKLFHRDWGLMVKEMLDFGIPLSASIRFSGKGEWIDGGGYHFKQIDLMETSIVAVPAHPRAVEIAKSYGLDLSKEKIDAIDLPVVAAGNETHTKEILARARQATVLANQTIRRKKT